MASPFYWPVLVPSALRAPAPVNLGVRLHIHFLTARAIVILMSLRVLLVLANIALAACDQGAPSINKVEKTQVFYRSNDILAQHPEAAILVDGGNTAEPFSFTLRPIGTRLAIPKNHLGLVAHAYQPWAKQIYDVATIVALLPNFTARNEENGTRLMNSTTNDRLKIILGSLAGDLPAKDYHAAVKNGTLVLDPLRSQPNVPAYRKSFDFGRKEPFFVLPNPDIFRTPLGNPILIICPATGTPNEAQLATGDCYLRFALPPSMFPGASPAAFGGVPGIRVYYYFNEKHLSEWSTIHGRVLDLLTTFIRQQ
jgi:hypothetical protein